MDSPRSGLVVPWRCTARVRCCRRLARAAGRGGGAPLGVSRVSSHPHLCHRSNSWPPKIPPAEIVGLAYTPQSGQAVWNGPALAEVG